MPSLAHRIVRHPAPWAVLVVGLFALPIARSMVRRLPDPPPVLGAVPDFALVDETGKPFRRAQLDGRVWVANFIFTRCPGVCPMLSARMERIQKRTRNLGRAFHLVSFSVDPERDTPADLAAYARRFHANPRGWTFLTGSLGDMEGAVVRGFKIAMAKEGGERGFWDIVHGEKLVLVDQRARIRGYYDASDAGLDQLVSDVALLVNGAAGEP